MKRLAGWLGLVGAVLLGVAAGAGAMYGVAAHAPYLWVLVLAGVAVAALLAAALARWPARWARLRPRRAAVCAGLAAMLPFFGLVAAVAMTPERTPINGLQDPRGPHAQLRVDTGSTLATWRIAPDGARRGTPVVFLHGGPGSYVRTRDFEVGAGLRGAGFETVYFDQAGSGASADLPIFDYSIARAVADVEALRKALQADRMVLWGQSWGASLAAAYVLAHPDRVAGVVFESPGDFPGAPARLDYTATDQTVPFSPTPRDAVLYLLINHAPQLADAWMPQAEHHAYNDAIGAGRDFRGYQCKGAGPIERPDSSGGSSLYAHQRLLGDLAAQPLVAASALRAPALVIRGECDFIDGPTARRYVQAFGATLVEPPGVGHGLFGHDGTLSALLGTFARESLAGVQ